MVIEATMVCMDNSEWMRNGDYPPTRFRAQADAVHLICCSKMQSNRECSVGLLAMAGKSPRVLITPTNDFGRILQARDGLEIGGEVNLTAGIQVAQLALKYRQNKHQRQRIVLFVGSPIAAEKKTLERMGKKLRKNNVALDIVSFDEDDDENVEKLETLLNAVSSNENSKMVRIPRGGMNISDAIIRSDIFTSSRESTSGRAHYLGVDPNVDPELALVLRISLEEEHARHKAASKDAATTAKAESSGAAADRMEIIRKTSELMLGDDTSVLDQALALSIEAAPAPAPAPAPRAPAIAEAAAARRDSAGNVCIPTLKKARKNFVNALLKVFPRSQAAFSKLKRDDPTRESDTSSSDSDTSSGESETSSDESETSSSEAETPTGDVNQFPSFTTSERSLRQSHPGVDSNGPPAPDLSSTPKTNEEKKEDEASKGRGKEG